ncbi:hypothetical protein ACRAWD_08440 [Caulobacter segnis]
MVDPLDGTASFMHAIPHFAEVNIALQRGQRASMTASGDRSTTCSTSPKNGGVPGAEKRLRVAARRNLDERYARRTGVPFAGKPEPRPVPRRSCAKVSQKKKVASVRLRRQPPWTGLVAAPAARHGQDATSNSWDIAAGVR